MRGTEMHQGLSGSIRAGRALGQRVAFSLTLGLALSASAGAAGQEAAGYFAGKTISLVVGVSAGGGYDQYARLLARHMPRYIPGNPAIIVRNMPGAGSLSAVLFTANVAPPDGLTITAFNSGLLNESMSEGDKAKVRFDQFSAIGSMARDLRVCYAWKEKNIRSLDDLAGPKEFVFGGAGQNSSSTNNVVMLRNLFGLKIKVIPAYRGNTEMNLAVERGELDGSCISWSSVPEDWIRNGKINILTVLSRGGDPDIPPSVRFIGDLAQTQEHKDVIDALLSSGEIGRPFIVHKDVPADRLAILRNAFDQAMKDPQLLEEAEKTRLTISAVGGADAQTLVSKLYAFPPAIIEKARLAIRD